MSEEEKKRVRAVGAKHGIIRQKMMSFRLDNDLEDWISTKPNKGRYINDLIRADLQASGKSK